MRGFFSWLTAGIICQQVLGQSSNQTLVYQLTEVIMNSTYPPKTSIEANALALCPFKTSYTAADSPYITLTQTLTENNIGCTLARLKDPPYCVYAGEKNTMDLICDVRSYRISLNANWIWNSVINGTLAPISRRPISLLVESANHGPVTVTFNLTIDTTTGSWFPLMGGFGGSFKKTLCNDGSYVSTIKAHHDANDYFRGLYIVCTDGTERVASELNYLTTLVTVQNCAAYYPINGVYADLYDGWDALWGMRFICADKTNTAWTGGIDKSYKYYQMCPKGSLVNGLFVQSGMVIDGFALSCQEVPFSVSYVKDEGQDETTPYSFQISEDSPFIYFNGSMFTGSIGYGGPTGIQFRLFIEYGRNSNGSFEIYSVTRKLWSALKGLPVTLKDLTSNYVRLRLPTDMIDGSTLLLNVLVTTPIGHNVTLPQQALFVNVKRGWTSTSGYAESLGNFFKHIFDITDL